MNLHKKENKKGVMAAPFGVAYVSRVENQAKRSSTLFIIIILKFVATFDRARVW